jgi:hypothetical protein
MEKESERSVEFQQDPARPDQSVTARALEVAIPYKTPEMTEAAMENATTLGSQLNVNLRLIEVHVVPYALPLDKPSVCRDHLERNLRRIAEKSAIPVQPELVFARDWEDGFRRALRPRSVVLIPIRKSWWRSHDKRMAERLRKHGHQVIWVECE